MLRKPAAIGLGARWTRKQNKGNGEGMPAEGVPQSGVFTCHFWTGIRHFFGPWLHFTGLCPAGAETQSICIALTGLELAPQIQ